MLTTQELGLQPAAEGAVRATERRRPYGIRAEAEFGLERDAVHSGLAVEVGLDLAASVRGLPEEQRIVVYLSYAEDLGIGEIAAVIEVPAGTVKSRLHHARQFLKTRMGVEYERA